MKKFVFQYMSMGASLGLMMLALAFLRGAATAIYVSQLAAFLVLLSFSTPFEAGMGNLAFKTFQNPGRIVMGQLDERDVGILWRALGVGLLFGVGFEFFPKGSYTPSPLTSILIGLLFAVRQVENVSRINLLLHGRGQVGQMSVNLFTAAKWLSTWLLFRMGASWFDVLLFCHIVLGIASATVLVRWRWHCQHVLAGGAVPVGRARIQDDVLSIAGVAIGVFSFQLDKLAVGHYMSANDYGQYVLAYTLLFVGPYLLAPVFLLFQQFIVSPPEKGRFVAGIHASVLRIAALTVTAAVLPVLAVVNLLHPGRVSGFAQQQTFVFGLASYLNCLSHIYYLRYQTEGRVELIFKQNLASAACAIMAGLALVLCNSHWYSLVLLSAAAGQYLFGILLDVKQGIPAHWVSFSGMVILLPFLWCYTSVQLTGVAIAAELAIAICIVVGLGGCLEALALGCSPGSYTRLLFKFVRHAR